MTYEYKVLNNNYHFIISRNYSIFIRIYIRKVYYFTAVYQSIGMLFHLNIIFTQLSCVIERASPVFLFIDMHCVNVPFFKHA